MEAPLFRTEVVQARQASWLGAAQGAQPPRAAWASAFAVAIVVAAGLLCTLAQWQRKVTVPGVLVPPGGLVQLAAPQSGVIARWLVAEGDPVKAGQLLAEIRAERHTAQGEAGASVLASLAQRRASLEAELRWAEQQATQRGRTLGDRLDSLRAEERQARADVLHARQRVQLAVQTQQRFAELARSGFVSSVQEQQKREELLELRAREGVAQRSVHGLQREAQAVQADLDGHEAASSAAQEPLRRALAALAQEEVEQRARMAGALVAPRDGRVGAIVQTVGQTVGLGQAMGHLVPPGRRATDPPEDHPSDARDTQPQGSFLQAHLFAPMRSAGFVEAGQTVWLRLQAFPYQKFGMLRGEVMRVDDAPVAAQELPAAQALAIGQAGAEALIRVVVRLDRASIEAYGSRWSLKPGSTLEADIVQDSRAIWEWIFEPLLAAGQRLQPGPAGRAP